LHIFTAHARKGYISISGLKYGFTFVFFDPDFLLDAAISAIRVHRFYFLGFYVCANFGENPSRNVSVRVHADGHTDKGKQTGF